MVKRVGGLRRKTRYLLRNNIKNRGKISLVRYFATFEDGQKVILKLEPSHQGGMFHRTFQGRVGVVNGKQGSCYKVDISDNGKPKQLLVHPIHLKVQN